MGNITSLEELDVFGVCVGHDRKKEDERIDGYYKGTPAKQKLPSFLDEDVELKRSISGNGSNGSIYSDSKTPKSARKSTAELAEVGMREGSSLKQRYINHGNLDDAFAEGLISADDYAQKLKRLDSLQNHYGDEEEKAEHPVLSNGTEKSPYQ